MHAVELEEMSGGLGPAFDLIYAVRSETADSETKPARRDAPVARRWWSAVSGTGMCAGDIPPDFPVAVRAIQVTDFARGLTMRAQIGTPRKTLLRDAEEAADLVLLSPRGNAAPER